MGLRPLKWNKLIKYSSHLDTPILYDYTLLLVLLKLFSELDIGLILIFRIVDDLIYFALVFLVFCVL